MIQRVGAAVLVVFIILLVGGAIAGAPDDFDAGEVVSANLSVSYITDADGYYEDGQVNYVAFREVILDVDADDEVIDSSEWHIFVENDDEVEFMEWNPDEDDIPENVVDRNNLESEQSFEVEREFEQSFSSDGRYTYYLTLAEIEGEKNWETGEWEWNIEEVDRDAYLFEIDQDLLSIFGRTLALG